MNGFDPDQPNAARVYDYLLGGKDNFAADRQAAGQLLRALPDAALAARANRAFLTAAARQVASAGVAQFVDVGAGLPTAPSVHESARSALPGARVAYVDHDPLVVSHTRALLATDDLLTAICADARDSKAILADPDLTALIDLREPVCVLFGSVLHFLPPERADAAVAVFRDRMAPGSYLVISAGHNNEQNLPAGDEVQAVYRGSTMVTGRSTAEIAAYFGGFELLPPGLAPVTDWLAGTADAPPAQLKADLLAGIGRKPS